MKLDEAKDKFIHSWGALGSQWGINRTMSQIQALLMVSDEALSTEEIMEKLSISRGNANMNLRTMIEWGLVYKEHKTGERKEFFRAEKDIWTVGKRVLIVKRQKELNPMIQVLEEVDNLEIDEKNSASADFFTKQIKSMKQFANEADKMITRISKSDESWFWKIFIKLFK